MVTQIYISRDYSSINQLPLNINRLYELFSIPRERNITKVKQKAEGDIVWTNYVKYKLKNVIKTHEAVYESVSGKTV